ncbi:MAG: stage II sporulation protein D [Oscillospiraceae bacterium]|nr:stage II sporulation protein D [Oscillospiraceae bacterium]
MKVLTLFFGLFAAITLLLPVFALQPVQNAPAAIQSAVSSAEDPAPAFGPNAGAVPEPDALLEFPVRVFPETFRLLDRSSGQVLEVSAEDYVRGAVAAEMPPTFHPEALKAQAVAAHTYALRCHLEQERAPDPELSGADLAVDPANWEGYITEEQARERFGENFVLWWDRISQAAAAAGQLVLLYEEEPIVAAYHAISAGRTEAAGNVWAHGLDYLSPAESFGDTLAPGFESTVQFSAQQVEELLKAAYPGLILPGDRREWLRVVSRSESGYVLTVDAGDIQVTGKDIRSLFGLRSSFFTVSYTLDTFTFTVEGYGHGVGLSQYGADYMARQGSSFTEILAHYYQGATLAKAIPQ